MSVENENRAIYRLEDVSFRYGDRVALEGLTLDLRKAAHTCVLGPNGAGKSTLLRLLSKTARPSSGRVFLEDRNLAEASSLEIARRVGVVPQETFLDFPFCVLEVVLMGRFPHLGGWLETDRDLAAAERAMEQTDVLRLADRLFHELSGGERQRVVLARALAQEPDVLLLDEPATFLDVRHIGELFDLLGDLTRDAGVSVISVLHDLNVATLYADDIVLLKDARVVASGTPQEVVTYANVKETYETEVYVTENELTGTMSVLPLTRAAREDIRRRFGG